MQTGSLMECLARLETPSFSDAAESAHQRWIASDLDATALLTELHGLASSLRPAPRVQWLAFLQSLRVSANLLTPMELACAFSIDDIVRQCDYQDRRDWFRRCRIPPDAVVKPKRSDSALAAKPASVTDVLEAVSRWEAQVKATVARGEQVQQQNPYQKDLDELARQQQIMHQQQDSWVQAIQEEWKTPAPRQFLAVEALRGLTDEVASLGIDLASERALTLEARDADHAVQLACLLSNARGCDLFRGQPLPWNPIPSRLRLPGDERLGSERWRRYYDWAQTEPSLVGVQDDKKLAAIAQHYGLPTYLLDFSYNPRVAAHFATHCGSGVPPGKAVIYCLKSAGLKAAHHHAPAFMRYYDIAPEMRHVDVDGLLRMQAQEGSFVFVNQDWWTSFYALDAIRFPRADPVSAPTAKDIYPDDRSRIELAVERYFSAN